MEATDLLLRSFLSSKIDLCYYQQYKTIFELSKLSRFDNRLTIGVGEVRFRYFMEYHFSWYIDKEDHTV